MCFILVASLPLLNGGRIVEVRWRRGGEAGETAQWEGPPVLQADMEPAMPFAPLYRIQVHHFEGWLGRGGEGSRLGWEWLWYSI